MKKIFTLALICFAVVAANAQNNVIFSEDFEGGNIPSGWTTNDADGDGYDWANSAEIGLPGNGGSDACMFSQSYDNSVGALNPDNWLITPQINLVAGSRLHFFVTGQDASWCNEHYGVYISTTGTNPSDFTCLFEETFQDSKDQATWQEKVVELDAYTGNAYIAFRHFNITDMFYLDLDDVTIVQSGVGVNEAEANQFSVYPNPAYNVLNIAGEGNAEICNLLGQTIMSEVVNGEAQINISNLEAGVYFVRMNGIAQKFIKK